MALATACNVYSSTANGDVIPGPMDTEAIMIQNGANANVIKLRKGTSSGTIVFQITMAANEHFSEQLPFNAPSSGLYVDMSATGAILFLYSDDE